LRFNGVCAGGQKEMSMCTHELTRRRLGVFAVTAAGVGLLPFSVWAAGEAEALALTCIDYRLVNDATRFFDSLHLTKEYDQVSLAGAALAAVSPKFPSSNAAFWDQLALAKQLHHVKKLIALDHRDCGAYKAAFGEKFASAHDAESAQHKRVMTDGKMQLSKRYPELAYEGYLMALDGTVERLV
jgi:hypothetical protein